MTDTTNITIAAGLTLARRLLNDDRAAFVECHIVPEAGLSADDQAIADSYTAAIATITGAAAEIQRLTAQRDALAARLAEVERSGPHYIGENAARAAWRNMLAASPQPHSAKPARQPLTDERIDAIADIVTKGMPDGIRGFCRVWGWQQFARALLQDCAGYYRAEPAHDGGAA